MIIGMKFELPNDAAVVPIVRWQADNLLKNLNVCCDDIYRSGVVLTEACSNVIRHAYDRPGEKFKVHLKLTTDKLTIKVRDYGKGFDESLVPVPQPGQIGGYGIYFIRETADAFSYKINHDSGTTLIAEINLKYKTQQAKNFVKSIETIA